MSKMSGMEMMVQSLVKAAGIDFSLFNEVGQQFAAMIERLGQELDALKERTERQEIMISGMAADVAYLRQCLNPPPARSLVVAGERWPSEADALLEEENAYRKRHGMLVADTDKG